MPLMQIVVLFPKLSCLGVQIVYKDFPKVVMLFSSDVSVLLQGIKITPFESPWSTMTRIESCTSAGGRSVIKSIEQLANGLVDFAPSVGIYAGFAGDLLILNCWQVPHPDM